MPWDSAAALALRYAYRRLADVLMDAATTQTALDRPVIPKQSNVKIDHHAKVMTMESAQTMKSV